MGVMGYRNWAALAFCGMMIPACQIPTKYPQELTRIQLDADRHGLMEARSKVHVVFLNGFDPLDTGHFQDLHNHIREAGYPSTYYGWGWNIQTLAEWMEKLPKETEVSRIVVITHGTGAIGSKHLAKGLAKGGREMDLLVMVNPPQYSEGAFVPEIVGESFVILSGKDLIETDFAEGTLIIPEATSFDTCSNESTREFITDRLDAFVDQIMEENPGLNSSLPGRNENQKDEWDYLRPKVDSQNGKNILKPVVPVGPEKPKSIDPLKKPDAPRKSEVPGLITRN